MNKNFSLVLKVVGFISINFIMLFTLLASDALAAKRALVYDGPGACVEGCAQAAYDMALRNGFDAIRVGPKALTAISSDADEAALFKDVALWIQPGGKSREVLASMTTRMVSALRNFVNQGGGYVGFCAGAFSSTQMVGTTSYTGFNIFPGRTVLYNNAIHADMIPIQWNGKERHVYWEGGPYITDIPEGKAEITAYYPNGQVASAKTEYGLGRVYVTGLHPEAPQYWRDYYQMNDADGLDYDLVTEMVMWATRALVNPDMLR